MLLLSKILRSSLIRLFAVCVFSAVAMCALSWYYPAQRELDISAYEYAKWELESDIEVFAEDIAKVQSDFGKENIFLADRWDTGLRYGAQEARVRAYVTLTPEASGIDFFPQETQISVFPVEGAWIDIDVLTSKTLGVGSGDDVALMLGLGKYKDFTVRGVFGVSPVQTYDPVVIVSGTSLWSEFQPGDGERLDYMKVALIRGMTGEQVRSVFAQDFYRLRFEQGGYGENISIVTREEASNLASRNSAASFGIIAGVSVVSTLALFGITLRESLIFSRFSVKKIKTLVVVGASQRKLLTQAAVLCSGMMLGAFAIGSGVGFFALDSGVLVTAFPPTLFGWFCMLNLCAAGGLSVLALTTTWWSLSRSASKGR
jgi:hypothetical protein